MLSNELLGRFPDSLVLFMEDKLLRTIFLNEDTDYHDILIE